MKKLRLSCLFLSIFLIFSLSILLYRVKYIAMASAKMENFKFTVANNVLISNIKEYEIEQAKIAEEVKKEEKEIIEDNTEPVVEQEIQIEEEPITENIIEEEPSNDINKPEEVPIEEEPVVETNQVLAGVWDSDDLLKRSNLSVEQMQTILSGTELESIAYFYIQCEKDYGINALFLAALSCAESGYGTSDLAVNKNNITSILPPGGAKNFSSKEECLEYTSNLLLNYYLTEGGSYYNGTGIYDVNVYYCPNDGGYWSNLIIDVAERLKSKL